MYENFVEEVDAVDNGISQWEEGEPRYAVTTTLSARVARLNPTWNQPNQDTEVRRAPGEENKACKTSGEEMRVVDPSNPSKVKSSDQHHGSHDSQARFKRAMDLVREEFLQRLDFYQHSWLPARALVEEALAQRFQVQAWEVAQGLVTTGWWLLPPGTFQPCPTSLSGGPKWGDNRTGKRWMPLERAPLSPGIWAITPSDHHLCYLH